MMQFKKIFLLSIALTIAIVAPAQNNTSLQKDYKNGKDLFNLGKYELAMEALKPVTRQEIGNPFIEYASFYYALAAQKAGRNALAKDMLLQIGQKYPQWEKIDDVHYWLADAYFKEDAFDKGIKAISKIKNKAVKEDALEMEIHYLSQVNDMELLKDLLQQNPYDLGVATVLAVKISERPSSAENRQLLDFLVSEFNLDKDKFATSSIGESMKKDSYNVAVFFPFMLEDLKEERKAYSNQFVLDTYEGIKLAVKQLNEAGKKINLYAYDTKKDSATTAKLLLRPEIRNMDLIIGPLYTASSKLLSDYTYKNKINMVNPLSTNSEVIGGNPMSFLFKPSLETQAKVAAEYASEAFNVNPNTMIVYGETVKDSILAFNYKKVAEKNGLKVVRMMEVGTDDARQLLKTLTEPEDDSLDLQLGHIFMATSDELVVANAISALEIRGDKLPVIALEDWLELRFVSFEQLERLEVRFISPNYINYENENVVAFKEEFIEQTNSVPTQYAYSGYDMMLFFGNMLHEYGNYFQQGFVSSEFKAGNIYPGYEYKENNDNQFVPLVRFKDATLDLINQQ